MVTASGGAWNASIFAEYFHFQGRIVSTAGLGSTISGASDTGLAALRKEIGIPHTLKDIGVGSDRIDELSEMAAVDPTAGGNPVPAGVPS